MPAGRLYISDVLVTGESLLLHDSIRHYLVRVLRLSVGDEVILFNGDGADHRAMIQSIEKKHVAVHLVSADYPQTESALSLTLVQSIVRSDRMDYAIQKAVELGVSHIVPLMTERCQYTKKSTRLDKKLTHWNAVAISAAQQSGRCVVPEVSEPMTLPDWLLANKGIAFLADIPTEGNGNTITRHDSIAACSVVVGPEGGLTASERALCYQHGLSPLMMGPRVLRTETAAVVALSLLQARWGDLSGEEDE